MNKLPLYSSNEIIRALQKGGFELARKSKGSHQALRRPKPKEGTDVTVVPIGKKEIPRGTFKNILRLANVDLDEFLEWL